MRGLSGATSLVLALAETAARYDCMRLHRLLRRRCRLPLRMCQLGCESQPAMAPASFTFSLPLWLSPCTTSRLGIFVQIARLTA